MKVTLSSELYGKIRINQSSNDVELYYHNLVHV